MKDPCITLNTIYINNVEMTWWCDTAHNVFLPLISPSWELKEGTEEANEAKVL